MADISFQGKIIGLTGGIGSGKDTLAGLFEEWGALILDADKTAKAVISNGTKGFQQVVSLFGKEVIGSGGDIDRSKVASAIFENPKLRNALELIIHPLILEEDERQSSLFLAKNPCGVIIKNSPLLIEVGLYRQCHRTILVIADEKRRLRRVKARHPHWKVIDIKTRMKAQMSDEEKIKRADFVVKNNARIIELYQEAESVFKKYF